MPNISTIKGDQLVTSSLAVGHPTSFVYDNDGLGVIDLSGSLIIRHSGSVPNSPAGAGSIFYDAATQKLRASQNGGSPVDLIGTTGTGSVTGTGVFQRVAVWNSDNQITSFDSNTFDGTTQRITGTLDVTGYTNITNGLTASYASIPRITDNTNITGSVGISTLLTVGNTVQSDGGIRIGNATPPLYGYFYYEKVLNAPVAAWFLNTNGGGAADMRVYVGRSTTQAVTLGYISNAGAQTDLRYKDTAILDTLNSAGGLNIFSPLSEVRIAAGGTNFDNIKAVFSQTGSWFGTGSLVIAGNTNITGTLGLSGALGFNIPLVTPPTSLTGTSVIYYDQATNKLQVSENGGAYQDLVGAGGGADGNNKGPQVGQNVYDGNLDSNTLTFRRLIAGTGMGLLSGSDTIMISYTGTAGGGADGNNLGPQVGQDVYNGNLDSDTLTFRRLLAGTDIGLLSGSDTIMISFTGTAGGADGNNLGPQIGQDVYNGNSDSNTLTFRRLLAGTNMGLLSGSDSIMISYTGSAGGADGNNKGPEVGQNIYDGNSDADTLTFRRLLAGTGLSLISGSDTVMISFTGSGGTVAHGVNVGGGQGVYNGNQDTDTLEFRSLLPGPGVGFVSGAQTVQISVTGSFASFTKTATIVYPNGQNQPYILWRANCACTASSFAGYILSGTRARACVSKNNGLEVFLTGTSIASSQSWAMNTSVHGENGRFNIGDTLYIRFPEITGNVGQVTTVLEFRKL